MVSGLESVSPMFLILKVQLSFIPSPSSAGSHFDQSVVGWPSGGLIAMLRRMLNQKRSMLDSSWANFGEIVLRSDVADVRSETERSVHAMKRQSKNTDSVLPSRHS